MITRWRLAIGAVLALALAGCSAGADATPTPDGSAAGVPPEHGDEPATTPAVPTSDAADLEAARVRAGEALDRYLRPGAAPETWIADLRPYLAPEAVDVVAITGPGALPSVQVDAGGATLVDGATAFTAIASVPTSGGAWAVSLRRDEGGEWLVTSFRPPAGPSAAAADADGSSSAAHGGR